MSEESQNEKFYEILRDFRTVIFITHRGESLHARPMAIAKLETSCQLWFITDNSSTKLDELEADPRAYLTCQSGNEKFLTLSGIATSTPRDLRKIDEIWKESFKLWFPEGKEDPSIVLVHFEPVSGEYWDGTGLNRIKFFFRALKAYVTETRPGDNETTDHGRVQFES